MTNPKGTYLNSREIPQAPNLNRVRRVVAAAVRGHVGMQTIADFTRISARHVEYALRAAQTLGLLQSSGVPTPIADRLVATPEASDQECAVFRQCVEASEVIRTVAPGLLSSAPPTKSAIAARMQRAAGLSKSTAEHRAGDLLSWRTQLLQHRLEISPDVRPPRPVPRPVLALLTHVPHVRRERSSATANTIDVYTITELDRANLLDRSEGHFFDFKSKEIAPGKLTRTLSAFANADGGELLIGVRQTDAAGWLWDGFADEEAANGHIQCFDGIFSLGRGFSLQFLRSRGVQGLVLQATVQKTRDIKRSSDGTPYIRRGAHNAPVTAPEAIRNLERTKGIVSFEDEKVANAQAVDVANSTHITRFMLDVVPNSEPAAWLRKQQLLIDDTPTVAGVLLFADEPQVFLPRAAVKIYRYRSSEREGTRETLVFDPITVEGPMYSLVMKAVSRTVELTEQIQIMTEDGLRPIQYPHESLHEIIANALLHRDYALNDDVHVRIFENRIEVESPGRLPAHITPANILHERFSRNPKTARLLNKFPNPPNKDVGEGLNTAFRAMKKLRLREPQIAERENSVLVTLLHEKLASPEQQIIEFVRSNGTIGNAQARTVTDIESEVKIRALLQKLVRAGELEQVPATARATTAYRLPLGKR